MDSSKYFEFARRNLVPFFGRCMNANIKKDPSYIFSEHLSGSFQPVWILPWVVFWTSKEVNGYLTSFEFIEGRVNDGTAEGRTYWTSPIGLILLEKKEDKVLREGVLRRTAEFDGWMFPKLEWLIDVLERKVFLQYIPRDSIKRIEYYTDAAEEARRLEEVAREEARLKSQKLLLSGVGAPVTDETLTLAKEVMDFDIYYDYSDDYNFCIRYRAYERELRQRLKDAGVEPILDNYISSVVNRKM